MSPATVFSRCSCDVNVNVHVVVWLHSRPSIQSFDTYAKAFHVYIVIMTCRHTTGGPVHHPQSEQKLQLLLSLGFSLSVNAKCILSVGLKVLVTEYLK